MKSGYLARTNGDAGHTKEREGEDIGGKTNNAKEG